MNEYERSVRFWNVKSSFEGLSKFKKTVILFNLLTVLLPISALYMLYGQSVAIGLTLYILIGFFTIFFIFLFTSKKEGGKNKSPETLWFKFKVKKLFQQPRSGLNSFLSTFFFASFGIVIFIQIFVLNLIFEAIASFSIMFILLIIFIPNSPKSKKRDLAEQSKLPTISEKNREIRLKRRFQIIKNKIKIKHDKRLKIKAVIMIKLLASFLKNIWG